MLLNSPRGPQCSMCDLPSESELITLNFFYARMTRRLWLPNVFLSPAHHNLVVVPNLVAIINHGKLQEKRTKQKINKCTDGLLR
jgi:hypothetical protein